MDNNGLVTITQEEYDRLVKDSEWLGWLEAAGIDNSEAYEYAQELRSEAGDCDE